MTRLVASSQELGITTDHVPTLDRFVDLFLKWNDRINLSAARTRAQIEAHVIDSLHVVSLLADARRVVDVGSGGGFPVIPAAICLPQVAFTSLEPVHKKHAFLRTAARELGLVNLSCLSERVQDHEPDDYDVAMSRATFDLREWLEIGSSLVSIGGLVLGFEAVERADLPEPIERVEYEVEGKRRAIVKYRRAV